MAEEKCGCGQRRYGGHQPEHRNSSVNVGIARPSQQSPRRYNQLVDCQDVPGSNTQHEEPTEYANVLQHPGRHKEVKAPEPVDTGIEKK